MRFVIMLSLVLGSQSLGFSATPEATKNLKAYPPAEKDMVRFVLLLPQQKEEAEFKVELLVGKTELLDPVNHYSLGGKIETEVVKGWGFSKYLVKKVGPMAGTLIGVDPNVPDVKRFVKLGGEPFMVRYNSRLPVVIYVPKGVEVRYRIWKAGKETKQVPQG